jgi:hypothetical protein
MWQILKMLRQPTVQKERLSHRRKSVSLSHPYLPLHQRQLTLQLGYRIPTCSNSPTTLKQPEKEEPTARQEIHHCKEDLHTFGQGERQA